MSKIVAIDFELANRNYLSACALGIVVYDEGEIIFEKGYLIKPVEGFDHFLLEFIDIHHIQPQDVTHAYTFNEVFERIKNYFENAIVIAHNADFDVGILKQLMMHYNLSLPPIQYACTVRLSRKLFPYLSNHKLNTVAEALNVPLDHHQAHSDAKACMHIALFSLALNGVESLEQVCLKTNVRLKHVSY